MPATTRPNPIDAHDAQRLAQATDEAIGRSWTVDRVGDLAGRRVLVTGGTRGLGAAVAQTFAAHGADVTVTGRVARSAAASAERLCAAAGVRGEARIRGIGLELASLAAIEATARALEAPIDVLVANAGVMWGPRRETVDGIELQVGVNAVGHFALVAHLLPRLLAGRDPRVVWVSSSYHRFGRLEPRFLDASERDYRPNRAYGTSKLAVLVLARELARRAARAGAALTSVAAHPGWTNTDLQARQVTAWQRPLVRAANALLAAPVDVGAAPLVCAATVPGLPGGAFVGRRPGRGQRSSAGASTSTPAAWDPALAHDLWRWATERSGVEPVFPSPGDAAR